MVSPSPNDAGVIRMPYVSGSCVSASYSVNDPSIPWGDNISNIIYSHDVTDERETTWNGLFGSTTCIEIWGTIKNVHAYNDSENN